MKKKAQTVSTDALVAIALFAIVVIFFVSFGTDAADDRNVRSLQSESTKLVSSVAGAKNASSVFVSGSKVSEGRIKELANLTYSQLKNALGIKADFCIYFEDEKGNVINVTGNRTGLGSSRLEIGGVACG